MAANRAEDELRVVDELADIDETLFLGSLFDLDGLVDRFRGCRCRRLGWWRWRSRTSLGNVRRRRRSQLDAVRSGADKRCDRALVALRRRFGCESFERGRITRLTMSSREPFQGFVNSTHR